MAKKLKGFRAFDELARKLVKVPPSEVIEDWKSAKKARKPKPRKKK